MWIAMSDRYRKERDQFRLKACCEDCSHFCAQRVKCGMLYPVGPHLKETFDKTKDGERMYFCKMFEAK